MANAAANPITGDSSSIFHRGGLPRIVNMSAPFAQKDQTIPMSELPAITPDATGRRILSLFGRFLLRQ